MSELKILFSLMFSFPGGGDPVVKGQGVKMDTYTLFSFSSPVFSAFEDFNSSDFLLGSFLNLASRKAEFFWKIAN